MKKLIPHFCSFTLLVIALVPSEFEAGQRRHMVVRPARVVVRHPVRRTTLVVYRGHPIHRVFPASVVVRPARRAAVVGVPLVFLPRLIWTAPSTSLPPGE